MRPTILLILVLVALLNCPALAQESWEYKRYHSLKDGNELYSVCTTAQDQVEVHPDNNFRMKASAGLSDSFEAGMCWGYIEGIVDSIPGGEGFEPDKKVRVSQYVDVVLAYLRNNPSRRHEQAYPLVRMALSEAFPGERRK